MVIFKYVAKGRQWSPRVSKVLQDLSLFLNGWRVVDLVGEKPDVLWPDQTFSQDQDGSPQLNQATPLYQNRSHLPSTAVITTAKEKRKILWV